MVKSDIAYAVVRVGGKQYKVSPGDVIVVDRVGEEIGEHITLEPLAVRGGDGLTVGSASRAKVQATVAEHFLGEKIKVFTYKPKKTFTQDQGPSQPPDPALDRRHRGGREEGEEEWLIRRAPAPAATAAIPNPSVSA